LEEAGASVTGSSLFAKEWAVAQASLAPPALGERSHRGLMTILPWVMQAASRYRLSNPTTKKQHQKHDQKDSNKPEAAVTVPVPVASESPAQSTGQKEGEDD
jgi:hypothetical protein